MASSRGYERAAAAVDGLLGLVAACLLAGLLTAALHDVSQAFDSGYYHLPFAARLVGILPPDVFVFHPANEARFAGFPLLGELLQGLVWRVTGRAEATALVALSTIPVLAWYMRRVFAVPFAVTVISLLAIPLVQTHATSTYVDLPANGALAVLVLTVLRAWSEPAVSRRTMAIALAAGAVAVNMKTLTVPMVVLALAALSVRAWAVGRRRDIAASALALPLVFATQLKNVVLYKNPFYPIRTSLLGVTLPGLEAPYASSPRWLSGAPQPVRFVCSLLEIGVRPFSDPWRWTVDQWMPSDADGFRMGGFFHAFVVANVGLLVFRAAREKDGVARRVAAGFGVYTLATSLMPQSHELRYYMGWMIVLVGVNTWLASRRNAPSFGPRLVGVVSAFALAIVAATTEGAYLYPSGSTFSEVVARKAPAARLARIAEGATVCVREEPWNLAFAAPFHPPKRYVVVEAEEASDCGGVPLLSP